MKNLINLLFLSLIFLFSCGSDGETEVVPVPEPMPSTLQVMVETSDQIRIAMTIKKPATINGTIPAVIFIHANNTDGKSEWVNSFLFEQLLEEGYIIAAFDIRTYGESADDGDSKANLLMNPDRAPRDLKSVVDFLKKDSDVDNARIGSKLGAEVGLTGLGNSEYGLKTAVALSTIRVGVTDLSSNVSNFQLQSVFYIASENESNGVAARNAQELFDETNDPKKVVIVPATNLTGSTLLDLDSSLETQIIDWFKANI